MKPIVEQGNRTEPVVTGRSAFLFIYFLSFAGLYLSLVPNFPLSNITQYGKYLYLVWGALDLLLGRHIFSNRRFFFMAGVFSAFILCFGVIWVNPIVAEWTRNHTIMTAMYAAMLFITVLEVNKYRCLTDFIKVSFLSISVMLIWCAATNFRALSLNPLYFVQVLIYNQRIRSDFGLVGTSNYMGCFCFVALVLSMIYFMMQKSPWRRIKAYWFEKLMLLLDVLIFLMFFSSSSRAPLLSFVLFVFFAFFFRWMYRSPNYRRRERISLVIVVAIVFVLVVSGAFSFMWENSNRQANIINNMPAFEQMGNVWTGMGFVDNSAFQTTWSLQGRTMSAWGVLTSSLDMYYVFLYFTTGVIGCTFIAVILLCMLFSLLAKRNRGNQYIFLSLFFSLLFYGFWESIWFSYRFWPMLILIALLWIVVSGQGQREEHV